MFRPDAIVIISRRKGRPSEARGGGEKGRVKYFSLKIVLCKNIHFYIHFPTSIDPLIRLISAPSVRIVEIWLIWFSTDSCLITCNVLPRCSNVVFPISRDERTGRTGMSSAFLSVRPAKSSVLPNLWKTTISNIIFIEHRSVKTSTFAR